LTVTTIILVATVTALVLWNLYVVLFTRGEERTISKTIATAAGKWPILPFAFGVLIGHWFW
jgi:hypothetical protein